MEKAKTPMPTEEWPIEIHDMTVAYNKRPVLYGIDLHIPEGQLRGDRSVMDRVTQALRPSGRARIQRHRHVQDQGLGSLSLVGIHAHDARHLEPFDCDHVCHTQAVSLLGGPFNGCRSRSFRFFGAIDRVG